MKKPIVGSLLVGKRQVRLLLKCARPLKKTAVGGLDNVPHAGLVRPIVNYNQIIVTAFGFLQKALQKIAFVVNASH
ncbi:MAG: hypothetical protein ABSH15_02730 [Verrucomicrobiota bacterium]